GAWRAVTGADLEAAWGAWRARVEEEAEGVFARAAAGAPALLTGAGGVATPAVAPDGDTAAWAEGTEVVVDSLADLRGERGDGAGEGAPDADVRVARAVVRATAEGVSGEGVPGAGVPGAGVPGAGVPGEGVPDRATSLRFAGPLGLFAVDWLDADTLLLGG